MNVSGSYAASLIKCGRTQVPRVQLRIKLVRQDLEMLAVVGEAADEGITNAKRQRETASK
jgi:hypothetical protein